MKTLIQVKESSLTGKSRSGGRSNWEHYVIANYDKNMTYSLEKKGQLILFNLDIEDGETLRPTDKIKIVDTLLVKKGNSNYAKVQVGRKIGFLNINAITKPTGKSRSVGSVIGGGKNSKEFTPDKFSLGGSEFGNVGSLVSTVSSRIYNVYGGDEYAEIRRYLDDIVKSITGHTMLNEKVKRFSRAYKTGKYEITDGDMKIISKNFGEVIGAMFLLKTNKKMAVIGFPSSVKEGLYDIYGKDDKGRVHYYSAKSAGGSSTSMANLNFIRKNFHDNAFVQNYMSEMEIIDSLINTPEYGTIYNINAFFNDNLSRKVREMVKILNGISKNRITNLEPDSLDVWLDDVRANQKENVFVDTMNTIYNTVLGDMKGVPKTSDRVLREMFNSTSYFHHGYLLYPMGSYIVKYLNGNARYIEALNLLTNFGSYISQITVDMGQTSTEIQIIKFSKNQFRFSYNGMSKAPGNRPIGFKEA